MCHQLSKNRCLLRVTQTLTNTTASHIIIYKSGIFALWHQKLFRLLYVSPSPPPNRSPPHPVAFTHKAQAFTTNTPSSPDPRIMYAKANHYAHAHIDMDVVYGVGIWVGVGAARFPVQIKLISLTQFRVWLLTTRSPIHLLRTDAGHIRFCHRFDIPFAARVGLFCLHVQVGGTHISGPGTWMMILSGCVDVCVAAYIYIYIYMMAVCEWPFTAINHFRSTFVSAEPVMSVVILLAPGMDSFITHKNDFVFIFGRRNNAFLND